MHVHVCTGVYIYMCVFMYEYTCINVCMYMYNIALPVANIPCSYDIPIFPTTVSLACRCS